MVGPPPDPYDWSTDQVVAEIAISDPPLAESLRVNEVDGEVLLTVCTYERLKTDIGIISMGKRSKVMRAIDVLRKRSSKYHDYIIDLASSTALPEDSSASIWNSPAPEMGIFTPAVQRGIKPLGIPLLSTPTNPRKRKGCALNNPLTPLNPPAPFRYPSATPEPPQEPSGTPVVGSRNRRAKPLSLLASGDDPLFVPDSALHFRDHVAVRIVRNKDTGNGEAVPFSQAQDETDWAEINEIESDGLGMEVEYDGRLRSPQSPSPVERLAGDQSNKESTVMETSPEPVVTREDDYQSGEQDVGDFSEIVGVNDSRKDFTVSPLKKNKGSSRKRRYLPPKGLTVDELIYGKLEVGDEILDEEEYDDGNFIIVPTKKLPGQQCYVEHQIRYLLQNAESVTAVYKGHIRTGLKPYKKNLVLKHYHQSITLFSVKEDGSCKVTKENTFTVNLFRDAATKVTQTSSDVQLIRFPDGSDKKHPQLNGEDNSIHDWDYLLKWQNIDGDRELPPIGESGSENEYSVETWEELVAESGVTLEKPVGRSTQRPLTAQEIREVLKEGQQAIVDNWRKRVLPRKEAQAWRIYRAAKKRRERKKTARDARLRIKDLDSRLEKMRDEIVGVGWTHKAHVKKQVKILLPTVVDREEQKWVMSLMERGETPERPKKPTNIKAVLGGGEEMLDDEDGDDEEDEESLGSTSEEDYASDSDEGMGGFIVSDNEKDVVNGVEIEVEGEKEVEEELARKAAENELIDSEGSEDDIPIRGRRSKETRRGSVPEGEESGDEDEEDGDEDKKDEDKDEEDGDEEEDQPMTGMGDDYESITEYEEVDVVTLAPKLDKGKGKVNLESTPPPNVKEEPQVAQVFSSYSTAGPSTRKDIPIIDLTMDDSPQKSPETSWKLKKRLADIPQYDLRGDDEEELKRGESRQKLLRRLVGDIDNILRQAIWFRLKEFQTPASLLGLFDTVTVISRQLHQAKFKNVPGLDEYGSQPKETVDEVVELKDAITSYNAKIYRPVAEIYVAWALGITDTTKKLPNDKYKAIYNEKKFKKYRLALIESLRPYCESEDQEEEEEEDTSDSVSSPGKSKGKRKSRVVDFEFAKSDNETSSSHRKRRPKPLVEDPQAKELRDRLKQLMKQRADREKAEKKRVMFSGSVSQNTDKIRVNLGKYARQNDIFFHDFLAKNLKPHQVEGIRFMWQQLIQTGENRGALLAHTMGLGKTLQVIALLYTIATAAASDDKKTFEQIPEHLRTSKTLILSPPGLVENWWDEFHRWLPTKPGNIQEVDLKDLGPIIRADGTIRPEDRLLRIQKWYREGGILLMGYQTFRGLIYNSPLPLPETQHNRVKNMLLDGPNIIIADEAHQLKNPASKVSDAARGFTSMSRIAMTGSPLSNNLLEYWSMIDWIDPSFLGPRKEFEQKYVQPIEDGLYADSGHAEKRKCLKMLRVLKQDIGPKVHRMDISVIENDLPAKTEFLIKVPLTELQLEMYRRFLKDPTTTGQIPGQIDIQGISGRKFFDAIHLLSLICNHPLAFVETLEAREMDNQTAKSKKQEKPVILDDDPVDFDQLDDLLSETQKPYPWAREVMNTVKDEMGLEHSYKMFLVKIIVDNAIKAKDQTLIFTHSVSTLNFLESHLKKWGTSYQKLDGRTAMNMRQAMTKRFNLGEGDVCLISTEAGGLGLNLPGANRIIIFDFKWSPMWEEQAIGRAFRLGQKKHVFVYRFHACGTYEEIMRNKVLFKNQLHSRVVDKKDPMRYATKNGKQYFNEPYDVPKEDLTPFIGMDPHILDKIISQVDFIRCIENTQTFQGDVEDTLTEEEIRESDELLQAEQQMRKAQGGIYDDGARKADNEYRKLNIDPPKIAEQLEMQISQEREMRESRLIELSLSNNLQAPLSPLNALSLAPIPSKAPTSTPKAPASLVKSKAPPPPPGLDEFVAPLPPTTAGRTKSVPDPAPKLAQKEKGVALSSVLPVVNTDNTLSLSSTIQKPAVRSPAKPVRGTDPPSLSDSTNKFGLSISSGLPKIFGGKNKRSPDNNSDSSDTGGSKKPKVSPAGILKLMG